MASVLAQRADAERRSRVASLSCGLSSERTRRPSASVASCPPWVVDCLRLSFLRRPLLRENIFLKNPMARTDLLADCGGGGYGGQRAGIKFNLNHVRLASARPSSRGHMVLHGVAHARAYNLQIASGATRRVSDCPSTSSVDQDLRSSPLLVLLPFWTDRRLKLPNLLSFLYLIS